MAEESFKAAFQLSAEFVKDIKALTEERDFSVIMQQALLVYYTILKHQVQNYKPALLPANEEGKCDYTRNIIFLDDISNLYEKT